MEEVSVAEKLERLVKLQKIDSTLDDIRKVRGDLPEEIQDLEDEIAGYETRIQKFQNEYSSLEESIANHKQGIKDSEQLIQKYDEQQMNVRNNREYDAITKEKELQELEIQILNKKIKESDQLVDAKKQQINETSAFLDERKKDLDAKKKDLETISAETKEEEEKLLKSREGVASSIEPRLYNYYMKLRANLSNGLAVVTVKNGAAEGCNILIPPQRVVEIMEKKKIIFDEYSGRILADVEIAIPPPVEEKKTTRRKKTTTKKK